jgi:hypothetical protein
MFQTLSEFLRSINHGSKQILPISIWATIFIVFIILVRYPSFILEPRFWAEERLYFETFHHISNWWEGFDTLQYPAYYNFLSRFGGFLASLVSLSYAPLATTLFGLLILLSPVLIIFFTESKYWDNLEKKIVLSLFLIFSCSTGEIWLNSTNPHFIFPVITFLILLDDNLKSFAKRCLYNFCIFIGTISGPFSLLMSPFFLFRYLRYKEQPVLIYCLIFLFFGLLHILFFYVSYSNGLGNMNRLGEGDISGALSIVDRVTFIFQFNVIFPLFGYFTSLSFRILMNLINTGVDSSYYSVIIEILPRNLASYFSYSFFLLGKASLIINSLVFGLFGYILYQVYKISNLEEKIHFLGLFLYLSIVISLLSIGGHGGFRYSYITSFILLFFIYQKFLSSSNIPLPGGKIAKFIVIFSISVGVFEYFPRVLSSSPEVITQTKDKIDWPIWKDEVLAWQINSEYDPAVWPYLKNRDFLWSERSAVYTLSLNSTTDWNSRGNQKFSTNLKNLIKKESLITKPLTPEEQK